MENLALPICPKCNETKHITRKDYGDIVKAADIVAFTCQECGLYWEVLRYKAAIDVNTLHN